MSQTSTDLLDAVELEPASRATHAVIWLHGLGADGHDFPPVVPELELPAALAIRWVFPHAPSIPVTINGGMVMRAWYDLRGPDLEKRHDEPGIRRSAERLTDLIARENRRGVPDGRIVLAGFSQGGAIAAHVALRHPAALGGLVVLSTYLVLPESLEAERAEHGLHVFAAHGTRDPMVTFARGSAARDRLRELGHDVEWHEFSMGHEVCLEELRALGAWLRKRFEA